MRIIKLSNRDIDFPDRSSVDAYFDFKLLERDPIGMFLLTKGRVAKEGITIGELIIFSYETEITHIAKSASGRYVNSLTDSGRYPFYFIVDVKTICKASGYLAEIEAKFEAIGIHKNIVQTQGWPTIPDSPSTQKIWTSLKVTVHGVEAVSNESHNTPKLHMI